MKKKDILVKSKYNRISVAFVKEGKKDKKAELRIWVTKGKCKPVYEETMIFDLINGDSEKFIGEVNELLKLLKEEYFDNYDEMAHAKEKKKEYMKNYLSKDVVREKQREYQRKKRKEKGYKEARRVTNAKYFSKVKSTYSGRKGWEPDEDRYIKNNPDKPAIELAKHLGRSIPSVTARKHKIVNGLLYMS